MNLSMINSMVGMSSLQQKIDTIANNMANINTVGYKSREVYFSEILSDRVNQPDNFQQNGRLTPSGLDQGYGARTSLTLADFSQGSQMETGIATDMMLNGENIFFTVVKETPYWEEDLLYTRNGHFQMDANRYLVTDNGEFLLNSDDEAIYIPEGAAFNISAKGMVTAQYPDGEIEELGSLKITKIDTPQVLEEVGNSKYRIPEQMVGQGLDIIDEEFDIASEENNQYFVTQGSLESSNLNFGKEMVQLNEAQRAYQFLSKGITISDQMMGIANNLKG